MSVDQAKEENICRVCLKEIRVQGPIGWKDEFREMIFPSHVILNFGKEFAHKECLQKEEAHT